MKLFIKNMISLRSINEVKAILQNYHLRILLVELGQVEIEEQLPLPRLEELRAIFKKNDFELVIDKDVLLVEKIRTIVIDMIYYKEELPAVNYSEYISDKLKMNYTYASKFFSHVKKITIEKFIISQKIERVKQLLLFNELTLSEIAWKLHYSSPAHLSSQFKKMTGFTPSVFKKLKYKHILPPENI